MAAKTTAKEEKDSKFLIYPLIIVMAIIPLIVHQKIVPTRLEQYEWFSASESSMDFFLYYKSVWIIVMAVIILGILCVQLIQKKEHQKITIYMIPIGIYGLLVILSMIFSENRTLSIHGTMEQFESGFVLLGYLIFLYYAYLFVDTEDKARFLIKAWAVSIAILCILGLLQVLGHDFFATDFGKKLILLKEYWNNLDDVSFTFGVNRIYLTLYNPNYVGVYATIAIPILVAFISFTKNFVGKVIYGILTVGMLICIVGSQSKTAFLSLAVVIILAIIIFRKRILAQWKFVIPGIIVLAIVFFVFDASIGHDYTDRIKAAFKTLTQSQTSEPAVTKVDMLDDEIVIHYLNNPLHISYTRNGDSFSIQVLDDTGDGISVSQQENNIVLQDERFTGVTITPILIGEQYGIQIVIGGHTWYFTNEAKDGDSSYYFYTPYGKWDKVNNPEVFEMNENIFSGRGYIWSRTIPLLKENIFIGTGPDTYTIEFPQDDYVGLENYGYKGSIMTKPHNMYLQIGVQTGVISLIAFLVFYIMYFVQSIRIYIKGKFDTYASQLGVGIFLASIGYMIAGITNDSTITVAPIFWILMGVGFSMNKIVKNRTDKE
ncbi:MAG: O-antigen ligase family protein [Clostridiales bacterium]|nr:O-antigen ligase family protein [Clostridiales bacterium]